ncbi:rhodanese-like domain-containing protein [Roseovarius sp.]|uniref:rhodanese-like domain-containing protein n=1 Tax=Roseovarius sp. TaxID=1486281 RepID=UPI003A969748
MDIETIETGEIQNWTPDEVAGAFSRGEIVLIDVRTPQEYVFEHIAGALLLPMPYFKAQYLPMLSEKQIVLYCGEGLRSEHCAREMLDGGSGVAAHLAGGFRAWKEADKPYIGTNTMIGTPQRMGGKVADLLDLPPALMDRVM